MEKGKDKLQKICNVLKEETLEPARQEAREIVENSHLQAEEIVNEAKKEAEKIMSQMDAELEKKKKTFESSMQLSCRQSLEQLRETIEKKIFHEELQELITKKGVDDQIIADLIRAVVEAIDKEGTDVDLSAYIPKKVPARKINELLADHFLEKLREKKVLEGEFSAGAKIKLHDKQILIDIGDEALKELVASYIHKDFRDLVFS